MLNLGLGLVGLLVGSELAVRGSLGLARRWGWPDWLAGLLLLALGTSLPELFVSVAAAPSHPLVALGTVFGSNVFNTCMVLGVVLLASRGLGLPLPSRRTPGTVATLIAALGLWVLMALPVGGANLIPDENHLEATQLPIWVGLLLLITYARVVQRALGHRVSNTEQPVTGGSRLAAILTVVGFALLAVSSNLFLDGALGLAERLGWEDGFTGYLIVAVGTSTPELFTCLRAMKHGSPGAVYGNLLGSNAFNLLVVGGVSIVVAGGITVDWTTIQQAIINFAACLVMMWMWTFRGVGRPRIHSTLGAPLVIAYLLCAWFLH